MLEQYPWPGNLRELEAVVEQSLAASAANPLGPEDLLLDGEPFAPLDAAAFGVLVEEEPEPSVEPGQPAEGQRIPIESEEPAAEPGSGARAQPERRTATHRSSSRRACAGSPPRWPTRCATRSRPSAPSQSSCPSATTTPTSASTSRGSRARTWRASTTCWCGSIAWPRFPRPSLAPVDVSRLLEELLDERRKAIHERRLLVLEELDRSQPRALCDPEQLRFAFEALLDKSLELVPERGDVYLASKRHASGLRGEPSIRVLLRFRGPEAAARRRPSSPRSPRPPTPSSSRSPSC